MAETSSNIPGLSGFVLAGGKARLQFRDRSRLELMTQVLSTVANPVRVVGRGSGLVENSGSLHGTGGVARSAGVVAKSKSFSWYSYLHSRDPLRDPAALLSQEDSLYTFSLRIRPFPKISRIWTVARF